jgi:enoyl-[acyl-carrier protein] reductase II
VGVPVIAAGGIADGRTMAAAFALGAEGVQMGTRMVSAAESPVHEHFKQAICAAQETDTVFLNRFHRPGLRALRTGFSERLEREEKVELSVLGRVLDLYFGGDMEASIALSGQVAGRIEEVLPVAEIFRRTVAEFREASARMAALAG